VVLATWGYVFNCDFCYRRKIHLDSILFNWIHHLFAIGQLVSTMLSKRECIVINANILLTLAFFRQTMCTTYMKVAIPDSMWSDLSVPEGLSSYK